MAISLTGAGKGGDVVVMDIPTILIGISQIAVTFLGFIAIFFVFTRRDGRFSPSDAMMVRTLLNASVVVLFGALIPVTYGLFDLTGAFLWQVSAATLTVLGTPGVIANAVLHARMPKGERQQVAPLHAFGNWSLTLLVFVLGVMVMAGWAGAEVYVLALIISLFVATLNFVTILLKRIL